MSTAYFNNDVTPLPTNASDDDAILRHVFHGDPLDPSIARRVRDRAAKVTDEIYRLHGEIGDETIHNLLREDEEL